MAQAESETIESDQQFRDVSSSGTIEPESHSLCRVAYGKRSDALTAGTIELADLAKRAESSVLVDRVRTALEESRDRDEFPKMNGWSIWTQELSAKLKYKKLTSREHQKEMFAIASELWEQLNREEEAGRISSFVRLSI